MKMVVKACLSKLESKGIKNHKKEHYKIPPSHLHITNLYTHPLRTPVPLLHTPLTCARLGPPLQREMCHLHGFTMILVQEVTFLTVAAMAVERLLAICHGYLYERLVTFSRCW